MTKVFDNIADDGSEKALRRGFTVPDGAVNLAWAKAPSLSPENNVVLIDTSKITTENQNLNIKHKKIAFANALGVLEDENGNEVWEEEYPIISDIFSFDPGVTDEKLYIDESIYPFVHVSRYFHLDHAGLAYGALMLNNTVQVKVVDSNGFEYTDAEGNKKYKIYIVAPNNAQLPANTTSGVYRVYVFLDMNPDVQELYLRYNKVELSSGLGFKNQEIDHLEIVNPRPYFRYVPEESDVIDQSNANQKIYSSKPVNLKEQIVGLPQPNLYGWKYIVPRKAIPDPRVFQIFRWRLACEITQPKVNENSSSLANQPTSIIRAGVIVPPGGNHLNTRANFLFYQLNETEYNFSKVHFVNPLKNANYISTRQEQATASYWHVDISTVSLNDLSKFDVLVWAPTATIVDIAPYIAKINYFTENVGGTFIFETSSNTTFTNLPGVSFSSNIGASLVTPTAADWVTSASTVLYDATPDDPNDTFSSYGMWKSWPPNVGDILNTYNDIGSILTDAETIAGWDLDATEKTILSSYTAIPNVKFQYMARDASPALFKPVIQARKSVSDPYRDILVYRKFNSGGNIFVSSGCFFEDHLLNVNGTMASRSLQVAKISDLTAAQQTAFVQLVSAQASRAETKLKLNAMLFATVNRPNPIPITNGALVNNGQTQSATVYGDWQISWVINPLNGVLSDEEKAKYDFILLPVSPTDSEPTWQRLLTKKTCQQIIKDKIHQLDPDGTNPAFNAFESATKRYFMMVTNPLVQVYPSSDIEANDIPTAWTKAYSPAFEVPYHLGSYVVRDEMVSGGVGSGDGKRIYPPKPYKLQSSISYINTSTTHGKVNAQINISGALKRYVTIPDRVETRKIWVPGTAERVVDVVEHWHVNGANSFIGGYHQQGYAFRRPNGIDTWSNANYDRAAITSFPYWGWNGKYGMNGPNRTGWAVALIQQMMNQFVFWSNNAGLNYQYLPEDGIFGQKTHNMVLTFQQTMGAKTQDGAVDAETWAMMGHMMIVIGNIPGAIDNLSSHMRGLIDMARSSLLLEAISDDNAGSYYLQISNENGGPSTVSETFAVKFNESLNIYRVAIMPFLGDSASKSLMIDWVDIGDDLNLVGYDFTRGAPGIIWGKTGTDGNWINIDVSGVKGNTVLFRATQNGSTGFSGNRATSRLIGIRDMAVYAQKYFPGTPGYYVDDTVTIPGSSYEETIPFSFKTVAEFEAGIPKTFSSVNALANWDGISINGVGINDLVGSPITYVRWDVNTLTITPSDLTNSFTVTSAESLSTVITSPIIGGSATFNGNSNTITLTYNGYNNTLSSENFIQGPRIGFGDTFYTKNRSGIVDPFAKTQGWITKDDGIKLICNASGKPFGFPTAIPTQATTSTHFARYRLNSFDTDQTLYYGFYDVARDEFITNSYGEPEISYYDYIRRGPQNVYIAVMTTYELDTNANIPGNTDVIYRPFKWAMPVYGVTLGLKSKVQIEPLSPDLTTNDVWALPIKTGSFAKNIKLRNRSEGSLVDYIKNYQGTTVTAYYDIPEARRSAWSGLFGRPYIDVKAETPKLVDDYNIQVRQAPILTIQIPTAIPTLADPWLPQFTVWKRASLSSSWVKVPLSDISDYNLYKGIITLANPIDTTDPRLFKVDYVSERKVYHLKHDGTNRVNLNPYINNKSEWINKPLYIYILPEYVVNQDHTLISESVRTRTLQVTDSSSIFNPSQVDYNPLAIMLGIVYITNAFNIDDLTILDTRRRGGGITTDYDDAAANMIEAEAESYWDVSPVKASSYQKGGFVIVRLPAALKDDFTESQIRTIIERNLTAGVAYQIEDLEGNRW